MAFAPIGTKDRYYNIREHAFLAEIDRKIISGRIDWWDRYNKERECDPVEEERAHSHRYYVKQKTLMEGVPVPARGVFDRVHDLKPSDHRLRVKTYNDNLQEMYDKVMTGEPRLCLDLMYPVLPEHDKVLRGTNCLSGLHGEGACKYLRLRREEAYEPAEKYLHPITTTFDYGWNSKFTQTLVKSEFRRRSMLKNELPGLKKLL